MEHTRCEVWGLEWWCPCTLLAPCMAQDQMDTLPTSCTDFYKTFCSDKQIKTQRLDGNASENGMARQETHQKGNTWCGFEWLLNVKVCVWTHTAHTFSGLLCIWHWAANAETPTLWRTPQCSDPCKTKYICDRILSFVTFHYLWQDAAVRMLHTGDTTASTAPSFAGRPRRSWRCLVIAYHHFNNRTP